MAKTIDEAVREVCLSLPEAEEYLSHGSANFRVRGKTFATYVVNHHGDGRVALWLNSPPGAQTHHVQSAPKHFFIPPYVGPRGWLGVQLDKGLSWQRIALLTRQAYEKSAPPPLVSSLGTLREIEHGQRRHPARRALIVGLMACRSHLRRPGGAPTRCPSTCLARKQLTGSPARSRRLPDTERSWRSCCLQVHALGRGCVLRYISPLSRPGRPGSTMARPPQSPGPDESCAAAAATGSRPVSSSRREMDRLRRMRGPSPGCRRLGIQSASAISCSKPLSSGFVGGG